MCIRDSQSPDRLQRRDAQPGAGAVHHPYGTAVSYTHLDVYKRQTGIPRLLWVWRGAGTCSDTLNMLQLKKRAALRPAAERSGLLKSKSKSDFAIITNVNQKFLDELESQLHFRNDKRIKFVLWCTDCDGCHYSGDFLLLLP